MVVSEGASTNKDGDVKSTVAKPETAAAEPVARKVFKDSRGVDIRKASWSSSIDSMAALSFLASQNLWLLKPYAQGPYQRIGLRQSDVLLSDNS